MKKTIVRFVIFAALFFAANVGVGNSIVQRDLPWPCPPLCPVQ
jgi:hypothetical protein